MHQFTAPQQKQCHPPPSINQTILPQQHQQCLRGARGPFNTFRAFKIYGKDLGRAEKYSDIKIKDSHLDKNSYTGGEIHFQMLSVRFFGRRVIRCGQNSSCHHYCMACLKTDFCITKKRPVYSLMNALINCNNVSYSLKGTSEKKKSAQLIPIPCCIFSIENKWNTAKGHLFLLCTCLFMFCLILETEVQNVCWIFQVFFTGILKLCLPAHWF